MPSRYQCHKSARLSAIAKQVYGPTQAAPRRPVPLRLVALAPAPSRAPAPVIIHQETDGAAYLTATDGVGCALRLSPAAVAFVRSLLD